MSFARAESSVSRLERVEYGHSNVLEFEQNFAHNLCQRDHALESQPPGIRISTPLNDHIVFFVILNFPEVVFSWRVGCPVLVDDV